MAKQFRIVIDLNSLKINKFFLEFDYINCIGKSLVFILVILKK